MFQRPEVDHALSYYLAATLPIGNSTIKQLPSRLLYRLLKLASAEKLPACYNFLPAAVWEDVIEIELMERDYNPAPTKPQIVIPPTCSIFW